MTVNRNTWTVMESATSAPEEQVTYALMDWDEVRTLVSARMSIGPQENHQIPAAVPPAFAREELVTSRKRIEEEASRSCWCFAYPNGEPDDFQNTNKWAVGDIGYLCAFTQIPGTIGKQSRRFALPRIPVPDSSDLHVLRLGLFSIQRMYGNMCSKR